MDASRYEAAKNTADIIQAQNFNTQRIVDVITNNEMQNLRDQLQAAQLTLGNSAQTATLISALRPAPIPAYVTSSPYVTAAPCGFM